MVDPVRSTGFQDGAETEQVRAEVRLGMGEAVTHTGLRREVHDPVGLGPLEYVGDGGLVGAVRFVELERGVARDGGEPGPFEPRVVVVVHRVDPHHPVPVGQEPAAEMEPDEAGGTGDDDR